MKISPNRKLINNIKWGLFLLVPNFSQRVWAVDIGVSPHPRTGQSIPFCELVRPLSMMNYRPTYIVGAKTFMIFGLAFYGRIERKDVARYSSFSEDNVPKHLR